MSKEHRKKRTARPETEPVEEPAAKSKKRKAAESSEAVEVPEEPTEKPQKKKKVLEEPTEKPQKKKKVEESSTTEQTVVNEETRREAQREIQQLVVRLRAEGKTPAEIDAAKRELKAKFGGDLHQPTSNYTKKKEAWLGKIQSKDAEEERKKNTLKQHELVVIPVFWRGRHDKLDVIKAAEDIKACVAQQGVDCWVDSRRHYTPGQKFAHWEHRNVMLRVEIGPEDLQAGVCRVCLAKTPGEFQNVQRKRVRLPPHGTRSLLLALKDFGLSKLDVERREGDSADEEEAEAAVATAKVTPKRVISAEESEIQGNWAPASKEGGKKKKGKK